jgi:hypothetical protein
VVGNLVEVDALPVEFMDKAGLRLLVTEGAAAHEVGGGGAMLRGELVQLKGKKRPEPSKQTARNAKAKPKAKAEKGHQKPKRTKQGRTSRKPHPKEPDRTAKPGKTKAQKQKQEQSRGQKPEGKEAESQKGGKGQKGRGKAKRPGNDPGRKPEIRSLKSESQHTPVAGCRIQHKAENRKPDLSGFRFQDSGFRTCRVLPVCSVSSPGHGPRGILD